MAERIFISYRRGDTAGYAGRLQGDLSRRYSEEHVFRDVEIPPGVDFAEHINRLLSNCNVVLVIIGPNWLNARDREGRRRIDEPNDWVRLEIERALDRHDVQVIPVLVDGAKIPPREELPESLLALRRRNAFELSDRRWDYDLDQLGKHLDMVLRGTSAIHATPTAPPPAPTTVAAAVPAPAPEPAPAPASAADHTTTAILAAAAVALLTAFPADLIARSVVHRAPLNQDDLMTVRDFVLQKAIFFGIVGALAALAVGFLSSRSREPIVSFLLGLGAGAVAGAVYAGAYAGLTLGAEGTDTSSTAVGFIAAGAFLGWAFGAERSGARLEAACAGLAGGLLGAGIVGLLHESLTNASGHRLLAGLCIAVIVAAAGFVGLRVPRKGLGGAELLSPARAAPPAIPR